MKILAPVDKSRRDTITLPYVTEAAQAYGAEVALLYCVPLTRTLDPGGMSEAEAYMYALEDGLLKDGLTVDGFVRKGDASSAIVSLAAEVRADMIILTTRKRSGVGKFVLGGVAKHVLTHSASPVLILHESTKGTVLEEEVRLQSVYIATVIWNKRARGLLTKAAVEEELTRISNQGLDREVLLSTYKAHEQGGDVVGLLDVDFQLRTLQKFLPGEASLIDERVRADKHIA